MRVKSWARVALVVLALGGNSGPAWAQTVSWVTPPPATAASGGRFTVRWQTAGFTGGFVSHAVAWGQTSLLGQTAATSVSGDVYEAIVDVPLMHDTLNVVAFAETVADGLVTAPVMSVQVSAFEALADLQAALTAAEEKIAALQTNSVLTLDGALKMDTHNGLPVARFTGVNVQIVNGVGTTVTDPPDGLGNLIVGYDEPRAVGTLICSDGEFDNQVACEAAGHTWDLNHKGGSHNLVVGAGHSYSRSGGAVLGLANSATRVAATVTGGAFNLARGAEANVAGGYGNTAAGNFAAVTGGDANSATGAYAAVTGGWNNVASGVQASVTGGFDNTAGSFGASISGGEANVASGSVSSVTGGHFNSATADWACVSGGLSRSASGPLDWRAGTLFEDN